MLNFYPLKRDFWYSNISEMVNATTNLLPQSRQEFFKGFHLNEKTAHKSDLT